MTLWTAIKEVINPAAFNARLKDITQEQNRLLKTLHLLEQPANKDVVSATDKAAEFH